MQTTLAAAGDVRNRSWRTLRVPMHIVVGTNPFQEVFTCANVTFMQAMTNHSVDLLLALILLVGSSVGARVAPGTYEVRLSVIGEGGVQGTETSDLDVSLVGLPALLSGLAREHGASYGIVAVVVAAVFGFLVGVVFNRRWLPGPRSEKECGS